MDDFATAGAAGDAVPAEFTFLAPTFGDWVRCGDISRTFLVASAGAVDGATATVEFALDPTAISEWFPVLTQKSRDDIRALDMATGKRLFAEMRRMLPTFLEKDIDGSATPSGDGLVIPLKNPIPSARSRIGEIPLRRISVGDWIDCGDVSTECVDVDERARSASAPKRIERRVNRAAVNKWMLTLTGLPEPILHMMSYEDARRVFAYVRQRLAGIDEGN